MSNQVFGCSLQTVDLGPSGNPALINDAYSSLLTVPNNGARMPVGVAFYYPDTNGRRLKYRYVRYNPTATVALTQNTNVPGIVFWTDNNFQTVSPTMSESVTAGANSVAGWLLNVNATPGNYVCIQVAGYLANAVVAASTAKDDNLIGLGSTPLICGRVASGGTLTTKVIGVALTAIATGQSQILVTVEDW